MTPSAADSGIPHTLETVQELMNLIDINSGGMTDWQEFQSFVANELESGAAPHARLLRDADTMGIVQVCCCLQPLQLCLRRS